MKRKTFHSVPVAPAAADIVGPFLNVSILSVHYSPLTLFLQPFLIPVKEPFMGFSRGHAHPHTHTVYVPVTMVTTGAVSFNKNRQIQTTVSFFIRAAHTHTHRHTQGLFWSFRQGGEG